MVKSTLGGRFRSLASRRTPRRGLEILLSPRECPGAAWCIPQPLIVISFRLVVTLRLIQRSTLVLSTEESPTSRISFRSSIALTKHSTLHSRCSRWRWMSGCPASVANRPTLDHFYPLKALTESSRTLFLLWCICECIMTKIMFVESSLRPGLLALGRETGSNSCGRLFEFRLDPMPSVAFIPLWRAKVRPHV